MELAKYLSDAPMTKAEFARSIGVSDALLYQWLNGIRPVAASHCQAIEDATHKKVTRKELRPKDYKKIWKDLAD